MTNLVELSIPTPSSTAGDRARAALDNARALPITNPEQYEAGAAELQAIKGKWKEIDEARKSLTRPIDEAKKRIQDFFRAPLEYLEQAESILKGKLVGYQNEQERLRREEQRRAEEAARKERERLEAAAREAQRKAAERAAAERRAAEEAAAAGRAAEAAKLAAKAAATESKAAEKAEQLEQQAAAVVAPIIQREAPKVAGLKMREVWRYEITDRSQIPLTHDFYSLDEKKIQARVNSLKADTNVPGIRVYPDKIPASASR